LEKARVKARIDFSGPELSTRAHSPHAMW
jgi:hypothetical protein